MVKVDYDKMLEKNREDKDAGRITKDEYDKNARKIRRQRRNAGKAPSQKKLPGSKITEGKKKRKTSTRKTRKRKPTITFSVETIIDEAREAFKKAGLKKKSKIKPDWPYHVFSSSAMKSLKEENPELNAGKMAIDKFKSRWSKMPTMYTESEQGPQTLFWLGEVEGDK